MLRLLITLLLALFLATPLFAEISDSENIELIGTLSEVHSLNLIVQDSYVYSAGNGLDIINVSNPSNPSFAGNFQFCEPHLYVRDNYAYIPVGDFFTIVDFSDPNTGTLIGSLEITGCYGPIVVSGNYAYVSCYNGLSVIDVSDPTNLNVIESTELDHFFNLAISGNHVYMIDPDEVIVFDVSNPTSPQRVDSIPPL